MKQPTKTHRVTTGEYGYGHRMPPIPESPRTAKAQARLAAFVESEQKKNRESLGFLPRQAIATYAEHRQIIPATANGQLVSYCILFDGQPGARPKRDPYDLRIYQLCTDFDARRLAHATHLMNQVYEHAIATGFRRIRLFCADDLPANDFWNTIGFTTNETRPGGWNRQRVHNLWVLNLPTQLDPDSGDSPAGTFLSTPTRPELVPCPFRQPANRTPKPKPRGKGKRTTPP
jgi:ribosomal protein S18 acetylase RimI-like enzyme